MDDIDSGNVINAITPTHVENLVQGGSTYGMYESLAYCTDVFDMMWMSLADNGLGMGMGLVVAAMAVRALYLPFNLYTQQVGFKMKLLQPDIDEI